MKILLTTDTWVPTINGVVTSTATLRAALTAQGHEVRVLTLSGDSHTYTKDGVTSLGSLDAGLVYPGARMRAPALNRAIRDLIDWHPDVVHSQCEFSTFAPARRIAHAAGAPLIHTYHTVYEDYTHYFSPSRSMGRKMAALFTRMICADCDAVIAPTPKISRLLAGYGVHCPVRIIPTGLDLQRFAVPRDDALRSRLGLPPKEANKTVLLSLGRLRDFRRGRPACRGAPLLRAGGCICQCLHQRGPGLDLHRGYGRRIAAALPCGPLSGRAGAGRGDRLGLPHACRAGCPCRCSAQRPPTGCHEAKRPPRRAALHEGTVRS